MEEETLLAMVKRWLHADEEILWRAVRSTLETFWHARRGLMPLGWRMSRP